MINDVSKRLKNLRLPLFAAPMFLISGPELVINACKAGVVAAFPTPNCRTTDDLEQWLAQIDGELNQENDALGNSYAPYAANLFAHRTNPRLEKDLAIVVRYKVPIVITALGSPAKVIKAVHGYGGLVFADVSSVSYAKKAIAAGADGLVLVCSGAGGHTGNLNPFSFIQEVRKFWDGYIALAGGISSGTGILSAQVAGADFAYMGTSFIATNESLAEPEYKQMILGCNAQDLVITKAFTGANASMMIPSIVNQGLDPNEVVKQEAKMNFSGQDGDDVKPWKGIWAAGQGVGCIDEVLSTTDLVSRLALEYKQAKRNSTI